MVTAPHRIRSSREGYTLIEVMMSLAVLAVGVTGIVSLQKTASVATREAQDFDVATNLARSWVERLRTDSLQWTIPGPSNPDPTQNNIGSTRYLCALVTTSGATCAGSGNVVGAGGLWWVPATNVREELAGIDALGRPAAVGATPAPRLCSNIRLTLVQAPTGGQPGTVRADVRVWWYRDGSPMMDPSTGAALSYTGCGTAAQMSQIDADTTNIHAVYVSELISGNPQ